MEVLQQVQNVVPYFLAGGEDGTAKRSLGAFHPKMLLLVMRTRLVVVVSTANLTPQMTVDMSWVQAFPRRRLQQQGCGGQQQGDFGKMLDDFLGRIDESLGGRAQQAQQACKTVIEGEAVAAGTVANGPQAFLRRHLGVGSGKLDAMVRGRERERASVDGVYSALSACFFPSASFSLPVLLVLHHKSHTRNTVRLLRRRRRPRHLRAHPLRQILLFPLLLPLSSGGAVRAGAHDPAAGAPEGGAALGSASGAVRDLCFCIVHDDHAGKAWV